MSGLSAACLRTMSSFHIVFIEHYATPMWWRQDTAPGNNEGRDMFPGECVDNGAPGAMHHQHHRDDQCHAEKHQAAQEKEAQQVTSTGASRRVWFMLNEDGSGQPQPVKHREILTTAKKEKLCSNYL